MVILFFNHVYMMYVCISMCKSLGVNIMYLWKSEKNLKCLTMPYTLFLRQYLFSTM